MECPPDDLLRHELELSVERMRHAEHEIELLGWLPTGAVWNAFERLNHERTRYAWLLRHLWPTEPPRDRES